MCKVYPSQVKKDNYSFCTILQAFYSIIVSRLKTAGFGSVIQHFKVASLHSVNHSRSRLCRISTLIAFTLTLSIWMKPACIISARYTQPLMPWAILVALLKSLWLFLVLSFYQFHATAIIFEHHVPYFLPEARTKACLSREVNRNNNLKNLPNT